MRIETSFRAAIQVLAELASDNHPPYVRVDAAGKLADILSPLNPRHADIMRELNQPEPPAADAPATDEDVSSEEDDDPL